MSIRIGDAERAALKACSRGGLTALELRRRLGAATYGDMLRLLSEEHMPLPRAPRAGLEEILERARKWLFQKHVA